VLVELLVLPEVVEVACPPVVEGEVLRPGRNMRRPRRARITMPRIMGRAFMFIAYNF
jgi:hypothetical protein